MPQDLIGCRKRGKLKAFILLVVVFVNDPPSADRRERLILLSFLLFDDLMVRKYVLVDISICTMEIQKIHMVVHIFSGFALFTELM